jgi:hypothetical protein
MPAVRARLLGDAAAAAALAAGHRAHELAERRAHDLPHLPGAVALVTGVHRGAGRRAVAFADIAGGHELHVEIDMDARERVGELDLDRRLRVRPRLGAGRGAEAAAEQRPEQIVEEAHVHEALGVEALTGDALVAVAVVARAAIVVGEHLVGLGHVAKPLLGVGSLGDVGVQLARETAEGLLDLAVARLAAHAEQVVVILLRHGDRILRAVGSQTPCTNGVRSSTR